MSESDFAIEVTNETEGTDYRWLRSDHGTETAVTGTLDLTEAKGLRAFISPLGKLPSGIGLGRITASKRYGLFDPTATDGREVLAGFLPRDIQVHNAKGQINPSDKAAAAVMKHGSISRRFLPVEAQRTSITYLVPSTAHIIIVD